MSSCEFESLRITIRIAEFITEIRTFKYPVTLKLGLGSLKVIENYTSRSGTYDFLLKFLSNHRPISHRFRDKWQNPLKIAYFSHPRVLNAPDEGVPLGIWYRHSRTLMVELSMRVSECSMLCLLCYKCRVDCQTAAGTLSESSSRSPHFQSAGTPSPCCVISL